MEFIDIGLYVSYGLLLIAAIAAIILPLINSFSNPKSLVKSGIGIAVIVILFVIGYIIADSGVTTKYTTLGVGEGESKFVGGALLTMYMLFIIAIVGIVITELNKAIK
jgi:hypothetical protein